jgi:hypothetical protein
VEATKAETAVDRLTIAVLQLEKPKGKYLVD